MRLLRLVNRFSTSREEIFGAIIHLSKCKTVEEPTDRATDSANGLATGIFMQDLDKVLYAMYFLCAGFVW
ncbi:unnamed protein product [Dibothriocephalus latus]|uniref:Aldehyde dehydrogenase domain-containing protein n=1 Tax=Dibothriocephalus latus TaxID=60516 RepID=A0A3P6TC06_DIBLA|nr:unnamed protein product [Dibothriocephalus latus]